MLLRVAVYVVVRVVCGVVFVSLSCWGFSGGGRLPSPPFGWRCSLCVAGQDTWVSETPLGPGHEEAQTQSVPKTAGQHRRRALGKAGETGVFNFHLFFHKIKLMFHQIHYLELMYGGMSSVSELKFQRFFLK